MCVVPCSTERENRTASLTRCFGNYEWERGWVEATRRPERDRCLQAASRSTWRDVARMAVWRRDHLGDHAQTMPQLTAEKTCIPCPEQGALVQGQPPGEKREMARAETASTSSGRVRSGRDDNSAKTVC